MNFVVDVIECSKSHAERRSICGRDTLINIPKSSQRQVVHDNITTFCNMFRAGDLERDLKSIGSMDFETEQATASMDACEGGGRGEGETKIMKCCVRE